MLGLDILSRADDFVLECAFIRMQREILRIPRADELEDHLHELFTCELGAWEPLQDSFAVLGVEFLALGDPLFVSLFELDPPVGFQFGEGCGKVLVVVGNGEGGGDDDIHMV